MFGKYVCFYLSQTDVQYLTADFRFIICAYRAAVQRSILLGLNLLIFVSKLYISPIRLIDTTIFSSFRYVLLNCTLLQSLIRAYTSV